jgi:aarF domain-containing kinase
MATRFLRTTVIVAIIAADYKYSLWRVHESDKKVVLKQLHQRSANRLLKLFKKQGGIYVKAGQHLSSLYYILPPEYCNTLRELHNKALYCDFTVIERAFQEEFEKHPDEMFDYFERTPVAAASLAQVHYARKNGKEYAVKVQFPNIKDEAFGDVVTIDILTSFIAWFFPEFKLRWLVREFRLNLPKELDFVQEGQNAERIRKYFENDPEFATPEIEWSMTTSRILTMEFIHGCSVTDIKTLKQWGFSPQKIAHIFNRVFCEQIFIHGFVHCDGHSGNVFVRPNKNNPRIPQLVLLDNGLYREYDTEFRLNYSNLWMSILQQDEAKIKEYSLKFGPTSYRLLTSILLARLWRSAKSDFFSRELDNAEIEEMQRVAFARLSEISDVLETVPSSLLLLFKTNDLMRVINHDLGSTPLNVFGTTLRYCLRSINEYRKQTHPGLRTLWKNFLSSLIVNVKLYFLSISLWLSSFLFSD